MGIVSVWSFDMKVLKSWTIDRVHGVALRPPSAFGGSAAAAAMQAHAQKRPDVPVGSGSTGSSARQRSSRRRNETKRQRVNIMCPFVPGETRETSGWKCERPLLCERKIWHLCVSDVMSSSCRYSTLLVVHWAVSGMSVRHPQTKLKFAPNKYSYVIIIKLRCDRADSIIGTNWCNQSVAVAYPRHQHLNGVNYL